jgi:hypothetical protein
MECVLGYENPHSFAIFYILKCSFITDFQNSPKNPRISQRPNSPKFGYLGEKFPRLATLVNTNFGRIYRTKEACSVENPQFLAY